MSPKQLDAPLTIAQLIDMLKRYPEYATIESIDIDYAGINNFYIKRPT